MDPVSEGPDPTRLPLISDADRERLRPGLDLEALSRLLARLPESVREIVLNALAREPEPTAFELPPTAPDPRLERSRDRAMHIPPQLSFPDPELQALLDQVLAPPANQDLAWTHRNEQYERNERPAREAPIVLAMPRQWHRADCTTVIVRRTATPSADPPDVILADPDRVEPVALDTALEMLVAERVRAGLVSHQQLIIPVHPSPKPGRVPTAWREYLDATLARLRQQPEQELRGIGPARSITFRIIEGS